MSSFSPHGTDEKSNAVRIFADGLSAHHPAIQQHDAQVVIPAFTLDQFLVTQHAIGGPHGLAKGDGVGIEKMRPRKGIGPPGT